MQGDWYIFAHVQVLLMDTLCFFLQRPLSPCLLKGFLPHKPLGQVLHLDSRPHWTLTQIPMIVFWVSILGIENIVEVATTECQYNILHVRPGIETWFLLSVNLSNSVTKHCTSHPDSSAIQYKQNWL